MHRTHRHSILTLAAVLVSTGASPLIAQATQQATPRTLTFTTASEEARNSTFEAAVNLFNAHPALAASHAKKALAADPSLGMARAMYAWANPPELTAEQREQELNRAVADRSEEHTSELQSLAYLVCRLLLEKKNNNILSP